MRWMLFYNISMANKIVQLVNEDGDNIYPLSADEGTRLKLVMSTVDIGEGQPLPDNTLYGVYTA